MLELSIRVGSGPRCGTESWKIPFHIVSVPDAMLNHVVWYTNGFLYRNTTTIALFIDWVNGKMKINDF